MKTPKWKNARHFLTFEVRVELVWLACDCSRPHSKPETSIVDGPGKHDSHLLVGLKILFSVPSDAGAVFLDSSLYLQFHTRV